MPSDDTREKLAEYAHDAWSGWMKYLFSKSTKPNEYGQVTIPAAMVQRWRRQMETPYAKLPESEKESDRAEADRMLEIMKTPQQLWGDENSDGFRSFIGTPG